MSRPKAEGGLGLRSARLNNVALLGKLVENLLHDHDKVWVQALTEKYFPDKLSLNGDYKHGDSLIWKGIIHAKNEIKAGFHPLLGDGGFSLWYDDWLGTEKLCHRVSFVHISDTSITITDLWRNGAWYLQALYTPLPPIIVTKICSVPVPANHVDHDIVQWNHTNDGVYSEKSAYEG